MSLLGHNVRFLMDFIIKEHLKDHLENITEEAYTEKVLVTHHIVMLSLLLYIRYKMINLLFKIEV